MFAVRIVFRTSDSAWRRIESFAQRSGLPRDDVVLALLVVEVSFRPLNSVMNFLTCSLSAS